jgi:hypothetical protein
MDDAKAQESLLSEYRRMRELKYCSGTPDRSEKHPFSKIIGAKPTEIIEQWINGAKALTGSDPDLATRDPFPFKIVFECKYFEKGGAQRAKTQLVGSIYQAFFYCGLPYIPSRKKGRPAWDYEFACLVAGDASDEGSLQREWKDIRPEVKRGFWEGANMIVRGAS